jgi:hypothetical protein
VSQPTYIKMDIWAVPDPDNPEGFGLTLIPPDRGFWMGNNDVKLGTTSVTFYPPENMSREEMVLKAIETLRDKQKEILARAQRDITKLDARINQLLMLTHQPDPGNVVVLRTGTDNVEVMIDDDIPF